MFNCSAYGGLFGWQGWLSAGGWMLLFWTLLLGTGIWGLRAMLHRSSVNRRAEPPRADSAVSTLAGRYARDEITLEEYQERLDHLL